MSASTGVTAYSGLKWAIALSTKQKAFAALSLGFTGFILIKRQLSYKKHWPTLMAENSTVVSALSIIFIINTPNNLYNIIHYKYIKNRQLLVR
jgi:hypothetical protein